MSARNTALHTAQPFDTPRHDGHPPDGHPPDRDTLEGDPLLTARDPIEAARAHVAGTALRESHGRARWAWSSSSTSSTSRARPAAPNGARCRRWSPRLPPMPSAAASPSNPAVRSSCPRRRHPTSPPRSPRCGPTSAVLRGALAAAGFGTAPLGADPARPVRRVNPARPLRRHGAALRRPRLRGARHGDDVGHGGAAGQSRRRPGGGLGAAAGLHPRARARCSWRCRPARPTSRATTSGWRSMRQQAWHGIDHSRSDPVSGADPAAAWAAYALQRPGDAGARPADAARANR